MRRAQTGLFALWLSILCGVFFVPQVSPQSKNPEWDKLVEAAKKEGKVVVSLPASNELRAAIERLFEKRYGIDVEPDSRPGIDRGAQDGRRGQGGRALYRPAHGRQ